jgi:leucyl/phenylalanyl-tRNA--protein transferase
MSVYSLGNEPGFPHPELTDDEGLLAIGGQLGIEWLIEAYSQGIFPWYDDKNPILWWSPNPRLILYPNEFKTSKSFKRILKKKLYTVKFDHQFASVIENCKTIPRKEEEGTWITKEMKEAYINLHHYGMAHSVEVYEQNELVGGLYGVSLGKAFFGESMFFKKRDASKVALYYLCSELSKWNFHFIDAQVETDHLLNLGAVKIPRKEFLNKLEHALKHPTCFGKWTKTIQHEF